MAKESWLEVSLTVDGELAEAVADVLARYVPNGVAIEHFPDREGHSPSSMRVCGYLPADDDLKTTRQKIEEALWHLGRIQPLPPPKFHFIQEVNWVDSWKAHYQPIPVGQRLLILPAWFDPPQTDRIPIRINPGMAFGTGTHPSTQLCLEFLEEFMSEETRFWQTSLHKNNGVLSVIDIGCGSGILSISAIKLGANVALGVDIDSQAVGNARENAALNGVVEQIALGVGSLAEVRGGTFPIQQAPLVVANIMAPVLIRLLDQGLADLLTPGGKLILSGILEKQEKEMIATFEKHRLKSQNCKQIKDWVALGAGK